MTINFEKIPSYEELNLNSLSTTRTVLDELNDRQHLVKERNIKCGAIRPLYAKTKRPPLHYRYKYFCVCPTCKPEYECKHAGNIIIDRDVLTQEEHLVYLARPRPNVDVCRKMPRYFVKKSIVANCTARVLKLAKPDKKLVAYTLNTYSNIISRRQKRSLQKYLDNSTNVEYTTIKAALELIREEKRLIKVAKRKERLCCQQLRRKIERKQRQQIRKIVYILFEEMKEFLLNDEFNHETSALGEVILQTIKDFTDKEFHMTKNLRDYQKTLAYNLAIWISKFLSNLNITVAENPPLNSQLPQSIISEPEQELKTFLPVEDYILHKDKSGPIKTKTTQNQPEPESETEKNCSVQDFSFFYSNLQSTHNETNDLPHFTADDDSPLESNSSDDLYFTARSMRPKK